MSGEGEKKAPHLHETDGVPMQQNDCYFLELVDFAALDRVAAGTAGAVADAFAATRSLRAAISSSVKYT